MLKIRLAREGVIKKPFYKIVATDERAKMSGSVFEVLGYWQPSKNIKKLDPARVKVWVDKGAQITPAVKKLLGGDNK